MTNKELHLQLYRLAKHMVGDCYGELEKGEDDRVTCTSCSFEIGCPHVDTYTLGTVTYCHDCGSKVVPDDN